MGGGPESGIHKSEDGGKTWRRVDETNKHGDSHAVAFVKGDPDTILNGSDGGVYATLDGGEAWLKLGGGVPTIAFRDIEAQERASDLVGASFGRGFFVLDDYSLLREMSEEGLAKEAGLFPVKKALQYMPIRPIDSDAKGCLGE